jgi:hypothetical protein
MLPGLRSADQLQKTMEGRSIGEKKHEQELDPYFSQIWLIEVE